MYGCMHVFCVRTYDVEAKLKRGWMHGQARGTADGKYPSWPSVSYITINPTVFVDKVMQDLYHHE